MRDKPLSSYPREYIILQIAYAPYKTRIDQEFSTFLLLSQTTGEFDQSSEGHKVNGDQHLIMFLERDKSCSPCWTAGHALILVRTGARGLHRTSDVDVCPPQRRGFTVLLLNTLYECLKEESGGAGTSGTAASL